MTRRLVVLTLVIAAAAALAAERVRERLRERRAQNVERLREGVRIQRDVAYGPHPRHRLDVYAPAAAKGAPVILMVHGGGWAEGDKGSASVVRHKAARWVPRGFVFVSANYRLLPDADPVEQARDVARAAAFVQEKAATAGADPDKLILMGHSAGAHLVALVAASPGIVKEAGVRPWLGSVCLDSAALDVVALMSTPHAGLYDRAFGADPEYWRAASPYHQLTAPAPPMLAVCSSRRVDACPVAERLATKTATLGMRVEVSKQDLTHGDVNDHLGTDGPYTDAVEAFLRSLDPSVARLLSRE